MKAVITGSEGFVGKHLSNHLRAQGHTVYGVDMVLHPSMNLSFPESESGLHSLISRCDAVFHLAGTAARKFCDNRPADAMGDVVAATRVLEVCRAYDVPCVVASSAWVYPGYLGETPVDLLCEHDDMFTDKPMPWYSYIKALIETIAHKYRMEGQRVTSARFFNIYGPGQENAITYPNTVVTWLIKNSLQIGRVVTPQGQPRDFVYIDDIVQGLNTLMTQAQTGDTLHSAYNLGSGTSISLSTLARMVASALDLPLEMEPENAYPGACLCRVGELGWTPKVDLQEGIRRTADSIRAGP